MKNHKIVNLKTATSGSNAVNFTQLNNEISNYLHLTGGTMKGDIDLSGNSIYGIKNTENKSFAVNREYVDQKISQASGSVDPSPFLKNDGSVVMTNNFNLNNNKLINVKKSNS